MALEQGGFNPMSSNSPPLPPEHGPVSDDMGVFRIPDRVGAGTLQTLHMPTGIRVFIVDYRLNQPHEFEYQVSGPRFGFGFCISGSVRSTMSCIEEEFTIEAAESAFFYFPDMSGSTEEMGRDHVLRLVVHMSPEVFLSYMDSDSDHLPAPLRPYIRLDGEDPCRFVDPLTPAMRTAVRQIVNCPYHGHVRRFFIQAKVMELIAYKLEQLTSDASRPRNPAILKSGDIDRVHHARDLLVSDLENAPDLTALARAVGMSRSKLHHCFRMVYGNTPFDYLRNRRLETARRLLETGESNVTEAAYSVGYSSLSHFTKVFKQHFGSPPGKIIQDHGFAIE